MVNISHVLIDSNTGAIVDRPALPYELTQEDRDHAVAMLPRNLDERITSQVLALIDAGCPPWISPFKRRPLQMPHNCHTKHIYGGINTILLWMESLRKGYRTNGWVTKKWLFDQPREEIRLIRLPDAEPGRTGQKSSWIIWSGKHEKEKVNEATGESTIEKIPVFKTYELFNLDQLEGRLADELREVRGVEAPPDDPEQKLRNTTRYVEKLGVNVIYGAPNAFYDRRTECVHVPYLRDIIGQDEEEQVRIWEGIRFHEITHWTGDSKRLSRKKGSSFGDTDYAFEELVAEMGAAFFSAKFGHAGIIRHASYIDHWRQVIVNDKTAVRRAASLAMKAVAYCDALVDDSSLFDEVEESVA